jgi:hypothetical protein
LEVNGALENMMRSDPTYEELATYIAHYFHTHLHFEESKIDGTTVWNVDNMCGSCYEIGTGALNRLAVMFPLDDIARRNAFSCKPADFAKVIASNKANGCSYDTLVRALICLLEQDKDPKLRNYCIEIGFCEPVDAPEIKWTPKAQPFLPHYVV